MTKPGDIVACHFADHCEGDSEPLACVVYGRIASQTKRSIEIMCWGYADGVKRGDHNETRYAIVRSAITKLTVLKPVLVE